MIIKDLTYGCSKIEFIVDEQKIFLEFDESYGEYVSPNYDGALILVLPIAMRNKEDIIIKGRVSYKLYHNVKNYFMKIINIMIPECTIINIIPDSFSYGENYDNNGVGCGLSCGIDSLCCLEDYYFNEEDSPYKLTHVTNFFAGASSNLIQYNKRLYNGLEYIKNTSLKMFSIITNFTKINTYGHQKIHVLRNLAIPLFFQKLFKKYYYSSGFSYIDCKIMNNCSDFCYSDPISIHLLSTENIEMISHGCQYTRVMKTFKILNNPLSNKFLDVCINGEFITKTDKILNCSICSKCLRTLSTIDYYGKLDLFKDVFDLNKYYSKKENYLKNLNINSPLEKEIIQLYKTPNNIE
jgi:hypothetical protein